MPMHAGNGGDDSARYDVNPAGKMLHGRNLWEPSNPAFK